MPAPMDWPTRDLLSHRVRTTPQRPALKSADSGESWTYRELDTRVSDVAGHLGSAVTTERRVAVLLDTRVAFVELVHAAMRRALPLVLLNVQLTAEELEPQLAHAAPDLLICEAATEELAVRIADCPVASVDEPTRDGVESLRSAAPGTRSPVPLERDRTQLLVFTSGTTGDPKLVRLTAGNLVASAVASAFRLGVSPTDRWLVCLPMYHMGGLAPILRSTLYGTSVVLQEQFDPVDTARVVDEYGVTGVSLVPTMLDRMLDAGWTTPASLRFVLLGGAPASTELIEECERRGVPVHPTYGMTETASQVATARPDEAFSHPGTVGSPLMFTELSVVDDDGDSLPPGEVGELVVSGPTVTPGYAENSDATAAAFGESGFHTGDVGYRDEAGRVWVLERRSDRIVTGGENVHPGEVASVLRSISGVRDAVVVGIDDETWGERVAALVVPENDATLTADGIRLSCSGRLAGYKRPRTVAFADALPRTASGTVDRRAVRERILDVRAREG